MSFFPGNDPNPGDAFACDQIELMLIPRSHDVGGLIVRRALPSAKRRMVGPFIFFDRMGPAVLRGDQALDVRPHPHIGLSTVTYLFDGNIRHRDSLGTEMVIQPGDVNLMTAGRGIVHSERSPEELRGSPQAISGLQTWLALPEAKEEIAPGFEHTTRDKLPTFQTDGAQGRLILGELEGLKAPVTTHHDTLYADVSLDAGGSFRIPAVAEERAIYTLDGEVSIAGDVFAPDQLLVFRPGDEIVVSSERGAHFMLFGGATMGSPRYIWWNFVSSSKERIEQAKNEWKTGSFDIVPGDEEEFIPLPES
ncbi:MULTISPECIES: pirin family protein [Mesorhizobium]|uniref:Pirin family protein n=1 Tax=Mesorhizobium denitrificans TaxID=2294114 RepID=A0A371XI02_9HYPH|nr:MULTISPECIES: pirin family protein [Mesorhizobium]RFC68858.1 pirin family protein [Mesorhizobium denitrificans]